MIPVMIVTIAGMIWALIAVMIVETPWPTRDPLSSPALSLDRLKVSYGPKKHVLISPANKAGFLSAIDNSTRRDET